MLKSCSQHKNPISPCDVVSFEKTCRLKTQILWEKNVPELSSIMLQSLVRLQENRSVVKNEISYTHWVFIKYFIPHSFASNFRSSEWKGTQNLISIVFAINFQFRDYFFCVLHLIYFYWQIIIAIEMFAQCVWGVARVEYLRGIYYWLFNARISMIGVIERTHRDANLIKRKSETATSTETFRFPFQCGRCFQINLYLIFGFSEYGTGDDTWTKISRSSSKQHEVKSRCNERL